MKTGARSRYRRLLEWQRERLSDPPGDVAGLLHRYCRFLHAEGLPVFRANLSLTTLHPQIKGLRYVWQADHVEPGPFPSLALVHRADTFRQRRQQADNALRALRKTHADAAIVGQLQG